MIKTDFLFYKDYLKGRNIANKTILVSKIKGSYLVGPKINSNFDEESFYRRLISNSIYEYRLYKKFPIQKAKKYINKYYDNLPDNCVFEIKSDSIELHKIIRVPRDNYGK